MEKTEHPFSCGFCQKLFSSTKGMLYHICTEHDSVDGMDFETFKKIANKPFVCAICSEPFAVDILASKHVEIFHSSKIERNIEVIDISSDDEENVTLLKEQPKSTPEACEPPKATTQANETSKATVKACDSPKSASELCVPIEMVDILDRSNNIKIYFGKTPHLRCSKCPKSFRFKATLKHHEEYFHRTLKTKDSNRIHHCQECDWNFKNRKEFQAHNQVHAKTRPFRCKYCDHRFDGKEMMIHERIHSGEKPYQCEICQKKSISLAEHLQHHEAFHK